MSTEAHLSRQVLEERITHCEKLVDTLNEVVADLQTRVLSLEKLNRKLLLELQQQKEASRAFEGDTERPPHY